MTMNSPESMQILHQLATTDSGSSKGLDQVKAAEMMREIGLKCISFNGIPRTINVLGAFHAGLPQAVSSALDTTPAHADRSADASNIMEIRARGEALWKSVYDPFQDKLVAKLAQSHPNLPRFILQYEYGGLLADPPSSDSSASIGRVLTSIVAVACLRAQTGVGPQVVSHVFGLRKAYDDGSYKAEGEAEVEGGKWLASDEGNIWLLECVDRIVQGIGEGRGTTFAPGMRAKL
ncbi:hypothetical protein FH972_026622 [Carpinus fangiana]|uniref:Dol-P-Man:Man(5)GlcNAc(2)-PP-Dol alpha-1,3-mannosyltransferase n=1 Tax=Carpinus fangiana TaxID=176857 RepID=A0A5N6L4M5_9ROSI|nr:hypothetical protein FH972_026622 [Carpinus fangiana]